MAQSLLRRTLAVFGIGGTTDDFEQFGSTAVSATNYTKDIATIQGLAAWNTGWRAALIASKAPVLQDMNAAMFLHSYMAGYVFQEGVPEYDAGTTYDIGSVVKIPYTGSVNGVKLFVSLTDANVGNALPTPPASNANWKYCGDLSLLPNLGAYRKPNLVYVNGTTATLETGLNGVSGQAAVLFGDLQLITDSTAGHIVLDLTRVASHGASPQSGLDTGTVANNTWYSVYMVKANSGASMVLEASLLEPIQANFATLNTNFGINGWQFLGRIRVGDQAGAPSAIVSFVQCGNVTRFTNVVSGFNEAASQGLLFATSASTAALSWTYAAGTSGAEIPSSIKMVSFGACHGAGSHQVTLSPQTNTSLRLIRYPTGTGSMGYSTGFLDVTGGLTITDNTGSSTVDLYISGFVDPVLGIGSNPLL